jgi:glycosyltransferase involved in cell wall biosynthesis
MTQLEAVCCGVPVLSSDGGGLTEIGTSNEITYFKNKDVGSLSQSLYKCVNEYDICLAKALKAREIIHKFSLDTYIQSLDKIYQSLL